MNPTVRITVMSDHRLIEDAEGRIAGIFVATSEPQAQGELVSMKLELPWGEAMDLHGRVEWVVEARAASLRRRPGMGLVCELQPWQQQLLERLKLHDPPLKIPQTSVA